MGKIVGPGDEPPKSVSTQLEYTHEVAARREWVSSVIKKYDEESTWDKIKSRDIPQEVLEYVAKRIEQGDEFPEIRRKLGILRATDKSWTKIMSALKSGYRIDGTAFLIHIGGKYKKLADKMYVAIEDALDNGVEVPTKDGLVTVRGPSKELASFIDAYNRLNQGFIKNGKDLGAFIDPDGRGGAAGGVTIVVNTNVPMPKQKDIEAHQRKQDIEIPPEDIHAVEKR